jgi:hypothetical protein
MNDDKEFKEIIRENIVSPKSYVPPYPLTARKASTSSSIKKGRPLKSVNTFTFSNLELNFISDIKKDEALGLLREKYNEAQGKNNTRGAHYLRDIISALDEINKLKYVTIINAGLTHLPKENFKKLPEKINEIEHRINHLLSQQRGGMDDPFLALDQYGNPIESISNENGDIHVLQGELDQMNLDNLDNSFASNTNTTTDTANTTTETLSLSDLNLSDSGSGGKKRKSKRKKSVKKRKTKRKSLKKKRKTKRKTKRK